MSAHLPVGRPSRVASKVFVSDSIGVYRRRQVEDHSCEFANAVVHIDRWYRQMQETLVGCHFADAELLAYVAGGPAMRDSCR